MMTMRKALLLFMALLAATLNGQAQDEENGYWKFREATVYGAEEVERSDDNGTVKETRNYDKGRFSVTRRYTDNGQTYVAKVAGVASGLAQKIKPGDEMVVSFQLTAQGGSGPRNNIIWGRATLHYARLLWTAKTWEDQGIRADREYDGMFLTDDNTYLVEAHDGQKATAVMKNNAITMKEASSDAMFIIVSCGGMDVVFRYQWVSTGETWICAEMTYPKPGEFKGMQGNVTYNMKKEGNDTYRVEYSVTGPYQDKRVESDNAMVKALGVNRFGETGYAKLCVMPFDDVLYVGRRYKPNCVVLEEHSSRDDQQKATKAKTDEEKALDEFLGRNTNVTPTQVKLINLANEGMVFNVRLIKPDSTMVEADVKNGFVAPSHDEVLAFQVEMGFAPGVLITKNYYWGNPEDLEKDDTGGSPIDGGEGTEGTGGGDSRNSGGGIPWGDIGIGVSVGFIGVVGARLIRKVIKKRKRKTVVKQKPGESNTAYRDRRIDAWIKDEGIKHPIAPEKGETFDQWRTRQEVAEREGRVSDQKHDEHVNDRNIRYGTWNAKDTKQAMQNEQDQAYSDKKDYDRSARNWDIAYKTAYVAKAGSKIGLKTVEMTAKATGQEGVASTAKFFSGAIDTAGEYAEARVLDNASVGEAATRATIKAAYTAAQNKWGNSQLSKLAIDTYADMATQTVKNGKANAQTTVKNALKNFGKNVTNEMIGDPKATKDMDFNLGGATAEHLAKNEIVARIFQ